MPQLDTEFDRLINGEHSDPHHLLGLHDGRVCLYRPGAKEIYLEFQGKIVPGTRIHPQGVFAFDIGKASKFDYRIYHQCGLLAHDPYIFTPTWGEMDSFLFNKGTHYKIFDKLGAKTCVHEGIQGVRFAVWAPTAVRVSLIGDFNCWDGRVNPMRSMGASGVWELFMPGLTCGERYKFEVRTATGQLLLKSDPYAYRSEVRPKTASIVDSVDRFVWHDQEWMAKRRDTSHYRGPLNSYEVHLGSWRRPHEHFLTYRELAHQLGDYCKEMGFTHVELMPPMEHPLDESWGYQVSGFFAVSSRFGTPEDFQYMVNHLHQEGIGVILDWVPAHFPSDEFALSNFDGTALYEHADPRQGYHPHWNTLIFNYGRKEVSNFLIGSALFFLEKMHIDGLRVDAVASMLYLDYGREEGGWIPNAYGGRENLEAIEFLKHLNSTIHTRFPDVFTIAEESSSFPNVSKPVEFGGLGFDYKWNMGWMHDTLRYFSKDPLFRSHHHQDLTFGMLYAGSENFVLPLSHDEVVHGKRSLLSKMPGDYWQQFANLRLLLSYQICQPGKKLLFMGCEFGQWNEWNAKEQLHWDLLQYPIHGGIQTLVRELNKLYLNHPPLWEKDRGFAGFEWVDFSDNANSVISYRRKGSADYEILCIHNFTPNHHPYYNLPLAGLREAVEILNTDDERFGGSNKKNSQLDISKDSLSLQLSPLATSIIQIRY